MLQDKATLKKTTDDTDGRNDNGLAILKLIALSFPWRMGWGLEGGGQIY